MASHPELGDYTLSCDGAPELLFTENESNAQRLWGQPNPTPYVKDAFHRYVISGERDAVNPAKTGTKAAARYVLEVPAGGCEVVQLRLATGRGGRDVRSGVRGGVPAAARSTPTSSTTGSRRARSSEDERRVHRQALAGMLWTKQYYYFDVDRWLKEHQAHPLLGGAQPRRPEHRVVPHAERRRHLHARQVGVPLVRGLGPGVPHASRCRSWTSTSPRSSSC